MMLEVIKVSKYSSASLTDEFHELLHREVMASPK